MTKTRTVISAALLILAAGQSGCSRSDDAQAAVRESGREFERVAVGNANASTKLAGEAFASIESMNAGFAGSENGYAEAAAIAVAQAKIGQSALASQDAARLEGESLRRARVIRGHINEWLTMSAIANAAGTFNPADDLREISSLIAMRQEDIAAYRTRKDQIESDIAGLVSKIDNLQAKSAEERRQGAEIELTIPDVSATEGARRAERVREHTLRGDQYGLEAVRIQGRVDQLRPEAEEYVLNVKKAEEQIRLLEEARAELQDRERSSEADAAEARAKAKAAQDAILKLADEYESFRSGEVDSANNRAISLARAAAGATRDANNAAASVGALTKASAQQLLAECLSRKSDGHAEASILHNAIAEAGLPGDWASKAGSENELAESTREEMKQAYQAAASALRAARARGESADKLEAAAKRLDTLGGVVANEDPADEYADEYSDDYSDDGYEEEVIEEPESAEDDG
ncbi:MAG: hypothetical protein KC996_03050 [Phycisphaerales bacterium]|nr:hypothetical protein [Phycisphaerales bacterium]